MEGNFEASPDAQEAPKPQVGDQIALGAAKTIEEQYHELFNGRMDREHAMAEANIANELERKKFLETSAKTTREYLSYEFALRMAGFTDDQMALLQEANHQELYDSWSESDNVNFLVKCNFS